MRDQTRKADEGKPRLFLVPAELDIAVGRVMTFGAKKYGARTWRGVDEESGLPHLWHLATNAAFLCALHGRLDREARHGR